MNAAMSTVLCLRVILVVVEGRPYIRCGRDPRLVPKVRGVAKAGDLARRFTPFPSAQEGVAGPAHRGLAARR
jgi:hypothetical protein